ncbi:uncharacterized protein EKO05_0009737 [Ascochyta rabiei]|uniref:uncharacterized protein n=1 Tax=Didymella rabiei TaxID=5454 RepID=UPI0022026A56|nr:uncharacterized protein EKO05_0009737 [Ascochyta rabiei]UPX19477.1 hypothetical protein EKO05_0009737 [Ascochyta rabiei]
MFGKNRNAKQASVSHNSKSASPAYADENHKVTPPTHAASSYMRSLREGNPNEKVEVPMIHSTHELSLGDYLPFGSAMKTGKRTVISRSMTRDCYIKHYAKDDEGNYIGTEKPYPDWQLVFVPNKGTPEDILRQVSEAYNVNETIPSKPWQLNQFVDVRHDIRRLHSRKELKHTPIQ